MKTAKSKSKSVKLSDSVAKSLDLSADKRGISRAMLCEQIVKSWIYGNRVDVISELILMDDALEQIKSDPKNNHTKEINTLKKEIDKLWQLSREL